MGRQSEVNAVLARIDDDIQRLQNIKDYLLNGQPAAAQVVAPKRRGRKPKKAAEPEQGKF